MQLSPEGEVNSGCNTPRREASSRLHGRCILGGQNLVHVRIVVANVFDFTTEEDWEE